MGAEAIHSREYPSREVCGAKDRGCRGSGSSVDRRSEYPGQRGTCLGGVRSSDVALARARGKTSAHGEEANQVGQVHDAEPLASQPPATSRERTASAGPSEAAPKKRTKKSAQHLPKRKTMPGVTGAPLSAKPSGPSMTSHTTRLPSPPPPEDTRAPSPARVDSPPAPTQTSPRLDVPTASIPDIDIISRSSYRTCCLCYEPRCFPRNSFDSPNSKCVSNSSRGYHHLGPLGNHSSSCLQRFHS